MNFPFLRYLNQILFDEDKPAIINPHRYWQIYSINHIDKCLSNSFLEHCWEIDYQRFVKRYRNFIEPHYLEENGSAFIEYCLKLNYRQYRRYSFRHPEEE